LLLLGYISRDKNNSETIKIKTESKMSIVIDPESVLEKRFTKRDVSTVITNEETRFEPNDLIVSRTDKRGTIVQCNDIFAKMSGWSEEELMGSNHNMIRHPDMPQIAFQLAWDNIRDKKEFFGYVKNLRKDGGYYWVFAYITADWDDDGQITGYTSYRRYAPKLAVNAMIPIYKILLEAEKKGGMELSKAVLEKHLQDNNFASYDLFMVELQMKANATLETS
jgi:PAS domain S-box-containing protein